MALKIESVDPDIFTIAGVFTDTECGELIERAESIGFAPASVLTRSGPKMLSNIRNNERVSITDPALAEMMWLRIASILPELDDKNPIRVDDRLRFYRYEPGQVFKRHKDGSVTDDDGNVSKLSYLIYLNSGFQGGETTFRHTLETDESRESIVHKIVPTTGSALLFRHARWHEGTGLTSGRKYVLRTDVFYEA